MCLLRIVDVHRQARYLLVSKDTTFAFLFALQFEDVKRAPINYCPNEQQASQANGVIRVP